MGAAPEGYTAAVTCGAEETRRTYPLESVIEGVLPTTDGTVLADTTLALPVGVECHITFENSPALAARGEVEVVRGDRRPYLRFASWNGTTYSGSSTPLVDVPIDDVPAKTYDTTFTVPGDARAQAPPLSWEPSSITRERPTTCALPRSPSARKARA